MRKLCLFLVLCSVLSMGLFADEDFLLNDKKKKADRPLSVGAGFTYINGPESFGGHFEFGFLLYSGEVYIQNDILLRAGGFSINGVDSSMFSLLDKISVGRPIWDSSVYTYIEGGITVYGNNAKSPFDDTPGFCFGFGGGFLFDFDSAGGFYIEAGYLAQRIDQGFPRSTAVFQTGWKINF